jgi:hypothetical protein
LLTPADVHYGRAAAKTAQRAAALAAAHGRHPERFVHGVPLPPVLPAAVWINKPKLGLIAPFAGHGSEIDALSAPRNDDRDRGRESRTPESGVSELLEVAQ